MGEPAYNLHDGDKPAIRPDLPGLRALEGGGEGDGKPQGKLSSVKDPQDPTSESDQETGSSKALDSRKLKEAENKSSEESAASGGSFLNSTRQKFLGLGRKKKAGIIGGIVSAVAAVGIFGSILGSGPFAFVHLAQLVTSGYAEQKEDESDFRLAKTVRFIYYARKNQVYNTRMTAIGNKYADRIEAKFNASGLQSNYSANFGASFNGFKLDKSAPQHRGKSDAQLKQMYLEKYGAIVKEGPVRGSLILEIDTNRKIFDYKGYKKQKSIMRQVLTDSGLSNKTARIEARVMAKRAGLSLSPLKRLDAKIIGKADARLIEWQERRAAQVKSGTAIASAAAPTSSEEATPEEKAATSQEASKNAAAADGVIDTAKQPDGAKTLSDSINSRAGRTTIGLAGIVGAACIGKAIDENYSQVRHEQNELPLMRTYARIAAIGAQIKFGPPNTDLLEQIGYEYKNLHNPGVGPNKDSSFMSSQAMKSLAGDDDAASGVAPDAVVSSLTGESPLASFSKSPAKEILKPACSTGGTVVLTAVSFLGGPVSAGVGLTLSLLFLDDVIDYLVSHIKGEVVDLDNPKKWGADYGTYIAAGAMLTQQQEQVMSGGRILEPSEVAALDAINIESQNAEFASASIAHKVFSFEDRRSLIAGLFDNVSPDVSSNTSRLANTFINIGPYIASTTRQFFTPGVSASNHVSPMRFNLSTFGFSESELDDLDVDNPFKNADEVAGYLNDPEIGPKLQGRVKKCSNISITKVSFDGQEVWDTIVGEETLALNSTEYKEIYNSENCGSKDKVWTKLNMFIKDNQNTKAVSCLVGDEVACSDLDFGKGTAQTAGDPASAPSGGSVAGEFGGHSDTISCAPGTKELGNTVSQYTGSSKTVSGSLRIKLCQLGSIGGRGNDPQGNNVSGGAVVNSAVAGAWQALGEKAKQDGVSLSAGSSFRLRSSCGGTGDGTLCAVPGGSLHQLGVAIDFSGPTGKDTQAKTCATRVRQPGNATWDWLNKNAAAFGFKQYSVETWHWDPLQAANRCGGDGS